MNRRNNYSNKVWEIRKFTEHVRFHICMETKNYDRYTVQYSRNLTKIIGTTSTSLEQIVTSLNKLLHEKHVHSSTNYNNLKIQY